MNCCVECQTVLTEENKHPDFTSGRVCRACGCRILRAVLPQLEEAIRRGLEKKLNDVFFPKCKA